CGPLPPHRPSGPARAPRSTGGSGARAIRATRWRCSRGSWRRTAWPVSRGRSAARRRSRCCSAPSAAPGSAGCRPV
ncbi:MAG: hypothetical protein AVDCRST_MAG36-1722, partial [uncultured Nocardioidaceae bacterium]